ncbi:MAG: leucine-rich repeat domain-containing protein [Lachnospiraceae bacterium]|nr:leucine-rich repeat domain-containing protein [Lachnospiraceae bacterium]
MDYNVENSKLESVREGIQAYEAALEQKRRKERIIFIVAVAFFILLYLYLRLFNTRFWIDEDKPERIKVFSTAWVVNVPSEYKGKQVTKLDGIGTTNIRVLNIEEGITFVAVSSDTLKKVKLPSTIKNIDYIKGKKLSRIEFPEQVSGLGIWEYAFAGTAIKEIVLPEGTDYVGEGVFCNCEKLKKVTMSNQITDIPREFFYGCEKLEHVTWPEGLQSIHPEALVGTPLSGKSMKELNFPDSAYYGVPVKYINNSYYYRSVDTETFNHDFYFPVELDTFKRLEYEYWAVNKTKTNEAIATSKRNGRNVILLLEDNIIYGYRKVED